MIAPEALAQLVGAAAAAAGPRAGAREERARIVAACAQTGKTRLAFELLTGCELYPEPADTAPGLER